jgi:hypothetical protein
LHTHFLKGKIILVETVPGMGKERITENDGGVEFKSEVFDKL